MVCVGGELEIPGQDTGNGGSTTAENAGGTRAGYGGNSFALDEGEHLGPQCQGRGAGIGRGGGYPLSSSRGGHGGAIAGGNTDKNKLQGGVHEGAGEDVIGFGWARRGILVQTNQSQLRPRVNMQLAQIYGEE